jgi:hypothetical protein
VFHDIEYAALKIFCKVHKGIKNVDFLNFVSRKTFKWFLTWWPQKQFGKN